MQQDDVVCTANDFIHWEFRTSRGKLPTTIRPEGRFIWTDAKQGYRGFMDILPKVVESDMFLVHVKEDYELPTYIRTYLQSRSKRQSDSLG